ncbi:MAG: single-stranded-DNA-specific exonuclease RecJ [Candidatus Omnitrophota bacterium]|jgi:single-stranded-DNA-specific exonuclease|nr:single-stranded-DNA-specific exonuclease RecJ [Candidatus Omnitrophota bacterium]MDD5664609.1 single-stranded-DNA-specific exonuclease RecJ [Candidatus Omnitrophota bacterium]
MHAHKILNLPLLNPSLQEKISKELKISGITSQVLINRGISSVSQADEFLNAGFRQMLDPFSFPDMKKSVERIKQAARNKEKVMIFGDYDVDGITSVALLHNSLKKLGIFTEYYMPHRIKEGYGLSKDILSIAKAGGVGLLITVDCGIGNMRQIHELKKNNIDTIITDHHQPFGHDLPCAVGIINPKVNASPYKYRDLAGVGVAFKLCQALSGSSLIDELDLVAIGTVADVVPLTGENRIIVKEGLKVISKARRPGLKALINKAGIRGNKFNPAFISFILAPRLNASGRIGSAQDSLNLLLSSDDEKAQELADLLEQHNRARQRLESRIMEEAEAIINKDVNFKEHKVIVVAKENWHQGVLGIVASKLADRFYRPAIVISLSEKMCKGSARSIKNFHLFNALGECSRFLDGFGGHAHAAGLTITRESIDDFRDSINRLAHKQLSLEDLLPSLDIDMELGLSDLEEKAVGELEKLAPFGVGNREPLFLTRKLKLKGEPRDLARETLKFYVSDGCYTREVIGFGMRALKNSLKEAEAFDMVYTARMDNWLNEASVILEAKDIFFR